MNTSRPGVHAYAPSTAPSWVKGQRPGDVKKPLQNRHQPFLGDVHPPARSTCPPAMLTRTRGARGSRARSRTIRAHVLKSERMSLRHPAARSADLQSGRSQHSSAARDHHTSPHAASSRARLAPELSHTDTQRHATSQSVHDGRSPMRTRAESRKTKSHRPHEADV
jgi:hypothetical protein